MFYALFRDYFMTLRLLFLALLSLPFSSQPALAHGINAGAVGSVLGAGGAIAVAVLAAFILPGGLWQRFSSFSGAMTGGLGVTFATLIGNSFLGDNEIVLALVAGLAACGAAIGALVSNRRSRKVEKPSVIVKGLAGFFVLLLASLIAASYYYEYTMGR